MPPSLFQSENLFRTAFSSGLKNLLNDDALGVFILVQANAAFDPAIQDALQDELRESFNRLSLRYRNTLRRGQPLEDAADDVLVFLKLMAMGIDHLQSTEFRREGPWELQYNQLRALRPARNADNCIEHIHQAFNPDGFNFNKPFLQKEMFWRGELLGRHVDLLYNKFPFLPLHGLLVPEARQGHPQYLTEDMLHYVWAVCSQLGDTLPGVGFGYNAYGASASVNHLHFQMFLREYPLPVTNPHWQHNGGTRNYAANCAAFASPEPAWEYLQHLNSSYNLIITPGRIYCLPRRFQGSYAHSDWTGGYAFYEMAGGLTTFNRDTFTQLKATDLEQELAKTRIS